MVAGINVWPRVATVGGTWSGGLRTYNVTSASALYGAHDSGAASYAYENSCFSTSTADLLLHLVITLIIDSRE